MKTYLVYVEGTLYGHTFTGGLIFNNDNDRCFQAADILSIFVGKPFWYFQEFANSRKWLHKIILDEIKCNSCYAHVTITPLPGGGYTKVDNCPSCLEAPRHPITHQLIDWKNLP